MRPVRATKQLSKEEVENVLSPKRFEGYLKRCGYDKECAMRYYEANVKLSEACYSSLNALEVTLRNKIHQRLTTTHERSDWYEKWLNSNNYADFHKTINDIKGLIFRRGERLSPDKMVAEFTFGFWVKIFNQKYERLLWKPLRLVFQNLDKRHRKRKHITNRLNRARNFRNRIYHYEPVSWKFSALEANHRNLMEILFWMDPNKWKWAEEYCEFQDKLSSHKNELRAMGVRKVDE